MASDSYVFDTAGNLQELLKKHTEPGCGKFQLIGHEKSDCLIVKWNVGDKTKLGCYNYPADKFQHKPAQGEEVKAREEQHKLLLFVHHKSIIMYNCKVVTDSTTK
ncbi:uncharacterized protein LOC103519353, partial [Diaphorina citri]|uniref:Uncharacterized protein LOC103519353 n=1 Tax=Diaphorina citri TaxID=121845 RepID=A0A1S4ENL2_DIACI